MSSGKIVQIIGAVVDVEFPRESLPKVYDALTVDGKGLVLEVQQQLGDGVVRTIAMGSSDGLSRGLQVSNTGAPISVPVGQATLGRIMNVLGEPIDDKALSASKSNGAFIVKHPAMLSKRLPTNCWKPALRLSTWFALFQKVAKSGCLAVRV